MEGIIIFAAIVGVSLLLANKAQGTSGMSDTEATLADGVKEVK